jgi:cytochrome c biogenesis protein CcmG, thiol:disulfide interchange protein DsbE
VQPRSGSREMPEGQRATEAVDQEGVPERAGAATTAPGGGRSAGLLSLRNVTIGFVWLGLMAFLVLLAAGLARQQEGSSVAGGVRVNGVGQAAVVRVRPAADFGLPLFAGGTFRLSEHRGQLVLVNFWASWCQPCREEARTLEAAWRRYRDRGVLLVGVNVWDKEEDARAFLQEFDVTYPNGPETSGLSVEYGLTGIPETYLVDRDGRLVRHWIGPLSQQQIDALIEELLS